MTPENANEVATNLEIAQRNHILLPDSTRALVNRVVKETSLERPNDLAILDAAKQCIEYSRATTPDRPLKEDPTIPADALAALERAGLPESRVLPSLGQRLTPQQQQDAMTAVTELTQAIALSQGNRRLLTSAFLERAEMNLQLRRADDVLQDAENLLRLGLVDLSEILWLEGSALFIRASPDDLRNAVRYFTVALALPAPGWAANEAGGGINAFRLNTIGNRAQAYYRLGQFEKCIEDSRSVLMLATQFSASPNVYRVAYPAIIASKLQLGDRAGAIATAEEWASRRPDDDLAGRAVLELQSPDFDREGWLRGYLPGSKP